jgi:hypothetical protein
LATEETPSIGWDRVGFYQLLGSPLAFYYRYITAALNEGPPKDGITNRLDMTTEVFDKHYDHAGRRRKWKEEHLILWIFK